MNNTLEIGGISALEIANEFGVPIYVYDADKIIQNYQALTNAFKGFSHKIKYALKANANTNILKLLKNEGAGLDAVSINEVKLGLYAGFEPHSILFTPNSVSFDEIKTAIELGVHLNIDNLSTLEQFGAQYGNGIPICIRINPHIWAGGHANIQTGHIDSKFGISIHQLRHVMRIVNLYNLNVVGLHMHTGSDILDPQVFLQAAEVLFDIAPEFPNLTYIDFGSGFKVSYKAGDVATDIEELGKQLAKRVKEFEKTTQKSIEIWFEPGKYIVSNAGYLITRVNVVKQTVSSIFAGVESGLNHLIRPMFYGAYHQILNLSNPAGPSRIYNVVGYICETDTFAYDRPITEIREGDILAICNAGAYGFSMSSNYNCRLRPAEVLVYNKKAHLIRKAETFEQLLQNEITVINQ